MATVILVDGVCIFIEPEPNRPKPRVGRPRWIARVKGSKIEHIGDTVNHALVRAALAAGRHGLDDGSGGVGELRKALAFALEYVPSAADFRAGNDPETAREVEAAHAALARVATS